MRRFHIVSLPVIGTSIRSTVLIIIALLLVACDSDTNVVIEQTEHVYTTWFTLELDKCASAWLIKRFVDPEAQFHFVREGEFINSGTPFDVPGAALVRTHDRTTYESIVVAFAIEDPAVKAIGKLIHTIEIDYWGKVNDPLALEVNDDIQRIIDSAPSEHVALGQSFDYFDRLYQTFTGSSKSIKEDADESVWQPSLPVVAETPGICVWRTASVLLDKFWRTLSGIGNYEEETITDEKNATLDLVQRIATSEVDLAGIRGLHRDPDSPQYGYQW